MSDKNPMIKKLLDILKRNDATNLCGVDLFCDDLCDTCPYSDNARLAVLIAELEEVAK